MRFLIKSEDDIYCFVVEKNKRSWESGKSQYVVKLMYRRCYNDYTVEKIIELINKNSSQNVLICGTDSELLHEKIKDELNNFNIYTVKFEINTTDQLFKILNDKIKKNEPPLNDYDGPVYLRASEAEVKLNN